MKSEQMEENKKCSFCWRFEKDVGLFWEPEDNPNVGICGLCVLKCSVDLNKKFISDFNEREKKKGIENDTGAIG